MNNHIQNKLSGFEAPPPAGVWDNIAEALDTENYFAQRLYDYQQQPKENIWNKIEANVEKSLGVKVVPFFTLQKTYQVHGSSKHHCCNISFGHTINEKNRNGFSCYSQ